MLYTAQEAVAAGGSYHPRLKPWSVVTTSTRARSQLVPPDWRRYGALPMTDRIADGQEHHRHITASYNIALAPFSPLSGMAYRCYRLGVYYADADGYN